MLVATATNTTEPSAASRDARRAFWVSRDAAMPMSIGAAARTRIARMRSLAYFTKHEAAGRARSSAGPGPGQIPVGRRRLWLQRAHDAVPHGEVEAVVAVTVTMMMLVQGGRVEPSAEPVPWSRRGIELRAAMSVHVVRGRD